MVHKVVDRFYNSLPWLFNRNLLLKNVKCCKIFLSFLSQYCMQKCLVWIRPNRLITRADDFIKWISLDNYGIMLDSKITNYVWYGSVTKIRLLWTYVFVKKLYFFKQFVPRLWLPLYYIDVKILSLLTTMRNWIPKMC